MPGVLEIHLPNARAGKTPARSVLTWLERALEITDTEHSAHNIKPYSCAAWTASGAVSARITVATAEQLDKLLAAAQQRMAFHGEWVQPRIIDAWHRPANLLLETAPPRTMVDIRTITPVIFISSGRSDPILTRYRLFEGAKQRWAMYENGSPEITELRNDAEVFMVQGGTVPFEGHVTQTGWMGQMQLKLFGSADDLVRSNALLMYAEMWGVGKGTTAGAGRIEVRSYQPRRRAR